MKDIRTPEEQIGYGRQVDVPYMLPKTIVLDYLLLVLNTILGGMYIPCMLQYTKPASAI
jgi:hypothetical protein